MHLTRRMRLIWHELWLIPLVGATADVVASEAAKLGGVTVPLPWLFSAIGVAGMLGAAVARAYSVPLIPEGLETPDEALTRRSRILGERLGATPVRVFVSDLPKLRGKVDTYLDGHDLFVSERVATLPEAERDFVVARALAERMPGTITTVREWCRHLSCSAAMFVGAMIIWPIWDRSTWGAFQLLVLPQLFYAFNEFWWRKGIPSLEDRTADAFALRATGNLAAATGALQKLCEREDHRAQTSRKASKLEMWWSIRGQKTVEASEWYQRERSLAAKAE